MNPVFGEIRDASDFEEFAAAFLEKKGFRVQRQPSEGPDGGADLKVTETFKSKSGRDIDYSWLVSCKHMRSAVGVSAEGQFVDRLQQHNCNGFMGFYSSRATTSLMNRVIAIAENVVSPIQNFDYVFIGGSDIISALRNEPTFDEITRGRLPRFYEQEILPLRSSALERGEE